MPTFERSDSFKADYKRLSADERAIVKTELGRFSRELGERDARDRPQFSRELRVKPMKDKPGIWEMTWEFHDGRATFEFGDQKRPGLSHVKWRRIGTHAIFQDP